MSIVELANDLSLRTFTRVIGDKELCRDQTYIDAFNSWSGGNMVIGFITLMLPFDALRFTLTYPLIIYHKHFRQRRLFNIAKSHVIRRIEQEKSGMREETGIDALKSAIKLMNTDTSKPQFVDALAEQLWQLTWAGAQSPTMTLANMFMRVLEKPEHGKALREEVIAAVESHGWSDAMLNQMLLMDSFIREVHRLYPIFPSMSFLMMERVITANAYSECAAKSHEPTFYVFRWFDASKRHCVCFSCCWSIPRWRTV